PDRVAEAVVDGLEPVQVEVEQGRSIPACGPAREFANHAGAGAQGGERVAIRGALVLPFGKCGAGDRLARMGRFSRSACKQPAYAADPAAAHDFSRRWNTKSCVV